MYPGDFSFRKSVSGPVWIFLESSKTLVGVKVGKGLLVSETCWQFLP